MLLRLNNRLSNHSSQLQCIVLFSFVFCLKADSVPLTALKGNDATLFALFKPFIFVVLFLISLLEPLQTKLRNDIIQNVSVNLMCGGVEGQGGWGRRMYS